MKELAIISNLEDNDARNEDHGLANLLKKYFNVSVLDIFDDSIFFKKSFFLIRNVWGREGGQGRMRHIYDNFETRQIRYSVPFTGMGDQQGKRYLVKLHNLGYPVVPTFDDHRLALGCGAHEYLLKPINGGSGKGIITVPAERLTENFDREKYIIQPRLKFACELSIFFVDDVFQYALKTKSSRWDVEVYAPTEKELSFARQFVEWNSIKGIQRIDFLKIEDGTLLMLELEDWCPYLSLFDADNVPLDSFIRALVKSMGVS